MLGRSCSSTTAGCRSRNAARTCSRPMSASPLTATSWRPGLRFAPACSTASGPGLPIVTTTGDVARRCRRGARARPRRRLRRRRRVCGGARRRARPGPRRLRRALRRGTRPRSSGRGSSSRWRALLVAAEPRRPEAVRPRHPRSPTTRSCEPARAAPTRGVRGLASRGVRGHPAPSAGRSCRPPGRGPSSAERPGRST